MSEQAGLFSETVDNIGRKAQKLGLSHDHEIVVSILEESKRLHGSLARYQVGLVTCEMARLSAGDRSAQLTRLWTDSFISYSNLGSLLSAYQPIDDAIDGQIHAELSIERKESGEEKKLDAVDDEFRKFMGQNPPPAAEDSDDEGDEG